MAQSKHEIESLLAAAGSRPLRQFGQNFMIDQNLVRLVAQAGQLTRDDCAIEVGGGTGTLTEELLDRAGSVVTVEIDRGLAALLRSRFGDRDDFRLIQADALSGKHALNEELLDAMRAARTKVKHVKLVANLPYNIASPLVIEMLLADVELLAFTVQKEVAARIRAEAGTTEYGPLSIITQLLARVEVLRTLPPQAFWPPPQIESSLVRLTRDDRLGTRARRFSQFIHALFSFRRKTLRRALAQAGHDSDSVLSAAAIDGQRRAEEFPPDVLLKLFEATATEG
jgi:16S rRNA (adenine1518-N6/adenine1519-N6)-dimethyltransferase